VLCCPPSSILALVTFESARLIRPRPHVKPPRYERRE
jgi:hypothetical protein